MRTFVIPFYYGSGTIINYGSGSEFLPRYGSGSGSGSTRQKVTVPVPVPQHWCKVRKMENGVYQRMFTNLHCSPLCQMLFICLFILYCCMSKRMSNYPLSSKAECLMMSWCLPVHLPTTAVFQREYPCPFFHHFCMLQVVYLFTCLPLVHVYLSLCHPQRYVRVCLSFLLQSVEYLRMTTFPFVLQLYVRGCVALSIAFNCWGCLPFHFSSAALQLHKIQNSYPLLSTRDRDFLCM